MDEDFDKWLLSKEQRDVYIYFSFAFCRWTWRTIVVNLSVRHLKKWSKCPSLYSHSIVGPWPNLRNSKYYLKLIFELVSFFFYFFFSLEHRTMTLINDDFWAQKAEVFFSSSAVTNCNRLGRLKNLLTMAQALGQ